MPGFRELFAILHNMDRDVLESAGVIEAGPGNAGFGQWMRFNNDIGTFVLKLPPDRLSKLEKLVDSHRENVAS